MKKRCLRMGPYKPPPLRVGDVVKDEFLGSVKVAGFTDSLIRWPGVEYCRGRHGGLLPILTGDLVRAVCEEDELAVAQYWGVTRYIVDKWKQALAGVEDCNQVAIALALKKADPEFRKRFGFE